MSVIVIAQSFDYRMVICVAFFVIVVLILVMASVAVFAGRGSESTTDPDEPPA